MEVLAPNDDPVYTAIMIELLSNFKEYLKNRYIKDYWLQKICNIIINNNKLFLQDCTVLFYEIDNDFI